MTTYVQYHGGSLRQEIEWLQRQLEEENRGNRAFISGSGVARVLAMLLEATEHEVPVDRVMNR